jgi:hypothetical protein
METIEPKKHSPIGASSAYRWMKCPGSVALAATLERPNATKYAAEGTVAHALVEKGILAAKAAKDWDAAYKVLDDELERSYNQDGFEIEVTENMTAAVAQMFDFLRELQAEHKFLYSDILVEVEVSLPHIDAEAFGTCDAMILLPWNRLIVIDYKHGQGVMVEVDDNEQCLYYGLGGFYATDPDEQVNLGFVELVIVQPRARDDDAGVGRRTYSVKDLLAFESKLKAAIERVRNGDPSLLAGQHCKFCPARPVCPEIRMEQSRRLGVVFDNVETQPLVLPEPKEMSPERLSQLLDNADELRSWLSSILEYATVRAAKGEQIPGYKMVEKKSNRRWVDEAAVIEEFSPLVGDEIFSKKLKSPAQLEKLLPKSNKDLVNRHTEQVITGSVLAKDTDSRREVATGAASVFSAFQA